MFVYTPGDVLAALFIVATMAFSVLYLIGYYGRRAAHAIKRMFRR